MTSCVELQCSTRARTPTLYTTQPNPLLQETYLRPSYSVVQHRGQLSSSNPKFMYIYTKVMPSPDVTFTLLQSSIHPDGVAQLVEHRSTNSKVAGLKPSPGRQGRVFRLRGVEIMKYQHFFPSLKLLINRTRGLYREISDPFLFSYRTSL